MADEVTMLRGFLDYQRATLEWKCRDLTSGSLNTKVAASAMTLGRILKHMNYVEDSWFSKWLHGNEPASPWDTVDWSADEDWGWHSAADDTPDELRSGWLSAVERSRQHVTAALEAGGLDQIAQRSWPTGEAPSLRWILHHMIEEYARHNGHADLLREAIDGQTGE